MTEFLLKRFVKDHENTQSSAVRGAVGQLAGITGIVCNVLLFAAKLGIGLLSGSIAILADAFNNLTDVSSSVMTLIGFRMARQPADKDHPYGHARYEYLSGLAVAAMILLIGAELVKSSLGKILNPEPTDVTALTCAVLALSMGLKLWMSLYFRKLGRHIDSAALAATAADCRNDVFASGAVLLGCLFQRLWQVNIDGYVGLAVAVFILFSGWEIGKQTISPLIGQQADRQLVEQICNLVLRHDKVLGVHDLLIHDYGPGQCFASVHVEISAAETPMDSHDIIDDIERDALAELNVHLVIHYDPVVADARQEKMRQRLLDILARIDPALSIHDFRLVRTAQQKLLVFDLEVPYATKWEPEELQSRIQEQLGPEYSAVISLDRKE